MTLEKFLKYIIWAGLISIFFTPLIVRSSYYFPFIVPKTLAFRVIVEALFLAYLGLAIIKKEYRAKLNLVLLLFFIYIAVVFVSSILGDNFYFSFWSNNERSEGLLLLLHLFIFLLILIGFLRETRDWLVIFDASFLGGILVSLVGLGQYFQISWILASSGGTRIAATIGNAGYVAGFLIFNVFFAIILFLFRKNKYLRWYYILGIVLQIFVILNTQTRGAILAIAFSFFVFIAYLAFFYFRTNKLIRNSGIIILLLMVVSGFLVLSNKQASWVRGNPVLSRVAHISFSSITAQNRLMTWQSSYEGFKEKPILGYGYESFYQVFDKYFNPKIYRDAGSVVWFDRAHNIIFDRLITGGIIGLVLYLSLLLAPLYWLWKYFINNKTTSQYFIPVVFTLLILAYFIQNLFIFEALVTYIPLFVSLGFLSQFTPNWSKKIFSSNKPYVVLLTISIIAFPPVLFAVNIKPVSANKTLIKAMVRKNIEQYKESYDYFIKAIEKDTFGNQEYRQHLGEFVGGAVGIKEIDEDWKRQAAIRTEQEFDKQIQEKPESARNYLMFMRYLNKTYILNVERLNKSLALAEKAGQLSPTRPHIYYEAGYSQYYLGRYYESQGQTEKAEELYDESLANFQKAIDLNDQVEESYVNMIMILFVTGQSEKVGSYLDTMDEIGLNYHLEKLLKRMAGAAINSGAYEWTVRFHQELTEIVPDKPDYWVDLSLSYAYLGEKDKAIETAGKVKEFGEEFAKQADLFIQDVLAGKFEK